MTDDQSEELYYTYQNLVIVLISPFTYAGIVTTETFSSKNEQRIKHNTIVSYVCAESVFYTTMVRQRSVTNAYSKVVAPHSVKK
jgi:hypothetical protein